MIDLSELRERMAALKAAIHEDILACDTLIQRFREARRNYYA